MFYEDIKDKLIKQKHKIIIGIIMVLGLVMGYIIEGEILSNFMGWWLLVLSIILLMLSVGTIIKSFRQATKKEWLSDSLLIIILTVLIYLLYQTMT